MNDSIQKIIYEYQKSTIQSEAEVRSKLIVPLLDALGYPSSLRAEEFPVYGFDGRKKLPAKSADFILFSDSHFAEYREFTSICRDWVYAHSLLIIEAKKPGEIPEMLGQPEYYTVWTKAVAYLVIDGIRIKGYFYNVANIDFQIIDCSIEDLPHNEEIWNFSFDNILKIKESKVTIFAGHDSSEECEVSAYTELTEDDLKDFPEESLQYMRYALGKNATGLNKIQLISRFLNITDAFLQNDLRYDIPEYMFGIPRHMYNAYLYVDNVILPIESGEIAEFYWENHERLIFENEYILIDIITSDGELSNFEIGFRALDRWVSDRLMSFERIRKVLTAKFVRVQLDDCTHRSFLLPSGNPEAMWTSKEFLLDLFDFWHNGLEQLRAIEKFYEIEFVLQYVSGEENVLALYQAIDSVYAGIAIIENCEILLPGGIVDEDVDIEEPIIFEEEIRAPPEGVDIHGIHFVPYRSWLLPGRIHMKGTRESDIVKAAGCCAYKIARD